MKEPLLTRLDDLIKQAETEKSHYYTASILKECRTVITAFINREIEAAIKDSAADKFAQRTQRWEAARANWERGK